MSDAMIHSISALIDALGGRVEVAKYLGIIPEAVSNWHTRGFIPTGWHLRLYLECQRRGLSVAPSVFELPPAAFDVVKSDHRRSV
jgi:hypothetical protein